MVVEEEMVEVFDFPIQETNGETKMKILILLPHLISMVLSYKILPLSCLSLQLYARHMIILQMNKISNFSLLL
jgi:hypothetical protein